MSAIVAMPETECVVEANAINAKLLDPVTAYVKDILLRAFIVKVEVRKEATSRESTYVRRLELLLVKVGVGKSLAHRRVGVIEHAIQDHMNVVPVAFVD